MKTHKDLIVWQKSIELVIEIYQLTDKFPSEEKFGLVSQMRRASISISSNIAEGSGRKSKKDFKQFVHMASGSLNEVESLLHICSRLDLITAYPYKELKESAERLGRLIGGLLKYLDGKK